MTQTLQKYNITLIGCGKMGASMIHGWLAANLINTAQILDPYAIDESLVNHPDLFHVKLMESLSLEKSNIIILAVKPQNMDDVCVALTKKELPKDVPVLSIAAGKSTTYFKKHLNESTPIIRAMPNTPAAIGKGMTALYATNNVTSLHKEIAERLFTSIGQIIWVDNEMQMDAVTAVSGSGPAYVFYLIEALMAAGIKAGLSEAQSTILARQTIIGAAALAESDPKTPPSVLRQNVTSKGGTTEAALQILMDGKFQEIMNAAILAAKNRGTKLSD